MRIMQHVIRIREIERRARGINLSLRKLCQAAGVQYSTVRRWERQTTSPLVKTVEPTLGALERALAEARRSLVANALEAAE